MSKRPWYKRYGADFVHGTLGLSLEEKGAYSLCLDLIYDRGGPIPDDPRWLAGVCGVSVRRWNSLRKSLIDTKKLVAHDGHLSNERAEKEIENALKTSRKLAENGAKGGKKRAENDDVNKENNDIDEAGLKHRAHKPEARYQNIPVGGDGSPSEPEGKKPQPQTPSEFIWTEGVRLLCAKGEKEKPARSFLGKQIKDHGEEVTAKAIRSAIQAGTGDPKSYITKACDGPGLKRHATQEEIASERVRIFREENFWTASYGDPPDDPASEYHAEWKRQGGDRPKLRAISGGRT